MLPAPCSERWKPLRAGLVDMFYYDAEEFWFHDGRLLLRGNNGTGKSKVLALTLPFLLDGELAPHRVEPDGDRQKKMEWNLLLGGRHPIPERLGYTWLEFGRRAADGTTEFRTIGCGLKAVAGPRHRAPLVLRHDPARRRGPAAAARQPGSADQGEAARGDRRARAACTTGLPTTGGRWTKPCSGSASTATRR